MVLSVFSHIKERASHLTFNSFLYNWSLQGEVADRLVVRPVDPWPGDSDIGAGICESGFGGLYHGDHIHGFEWLRDLRSFAEKSSKADAEICRAQARGMIASWTQKYRGWDAEAWRADVTGRRLSIWISLYEFFSHDCLDGACDEEFHDLFFDSLGRQSLHLSRALTASRRVQGIALLEAAKGLLYSGLALEGREVLVDQALDIFEDEAEHQILGDGAHISQNAQQLLQALQIYVDVRSALRAGGYPLPESIQHAIDRMGPAVRFFRYHDKGFAVFNGGQEGDIGFIDRVLAQTGAKGKTPSSLPCAGYERIQLGRGFLMFDCGNSPAKPFNESAHVAPLSFEMSYGRERLFVNCGSHTDDAAWQDALRCTAAHNTVCLDNRNACEIGTDRSIVRKPNKVTVIREDSDKACFLEGMHDGYERLNGYTHRRRLYMSEDGHDLRGEDILCSKHQASRPVEAAVRFHLHPRVNVSLINGGSEALLRLPSGIGWRFRFGGGGLMLEDSIYMGDGVKPRKTKQLAIYSQATEKELRIKWALQKEG